MIGKIAFKMPCDDEGGRRLKLGSDDDRGFGGAVLPTLGPVGLGELAIESGRISWRDLLLELRNGMPILLVLIRRHIAIRFTQTVLGLAWLVVQPVLTSFVFSMIIGALVEVRGGSAGYFLMTFTAFVPWTGFVQGAERSAMSLTWDERLVNKVYFPRILLPMAAVGSALVDLAVSSSILLLWTACLGDVRWDALVCLPAGIVLLATSALAVGLVLSAASLRFRDLRQVHSFLFQIWMLLTPVAYPSSLLGPRWEEVAYLNPMATVVALFRHSLIGDPLPDATLMLISTTLSIGLLLLGVFSFQKVEPRMADLL